MDKSDFLYPRPGSNGFCVQPGQAKVSGSATPGQKQVNQWPQRKSCSLD